MGEYNVTVMASLSPIGDLADDIGRSAQERLSQELRDRGDLGPEAFAGVSSIEMEFRVMGYYADSRQEAEDAVSDMILDIEAVESIVSVESEQVGD